MGSEEYDFAVIKLDRPAPLKRFLKLKVCGDKMNKEVKVQGYEMLKLSRQTRSLKLYFHSGNVDRETEYAIYYNVDTKTQQSGSPVIFNNRGEIEVVGIHKGHNPRINLNVGTKITRELVSMVKGWAREMNAAFKLHRSPTIDEEMDEKSKEYIENLIVEKEKLDEEHSAEIEKITREL